MQQQGRIAAIIEDQIGMRGLRPLEDLVRVLPVLDQRFAFVGKHGRAACGNRGGGVVLGREHVAGGPAHLGAEGLQRLDQHRGLNGHVQRAGDARAAQRLRGCEFLADGHKTGHLGLGDGDFLAAPVGELQVGDVVVRGSVGCGNRAGSGSHGGSKFLRIKVCERG